MNHFLLTFVGMAIFIAAAHPKKINFSAFAIGLCAVLSLVVAVAFERVPVSAFGLANNWEIFGYGIVASLAGCALGWAKIFILERFGVSMEIKDPPLTEYAQTE